MLKRENRLDLVYWILIGIFGVSIIEFFGRRFSNFVVDDAYISLQYARSLLEGNGLIWSDGPSIPVEGYSNLLWVLCIAGVSWVTGINPETSMMILGHLGMWMAISAIAYYGVRERNFFGAMIGVVVFATLPTTQAWLYGGLEQSLLAGLLSWGIITSFPLLRREAKTIEAVTPAIFFSLLCLTRPDSPLFVVMGTVLIFILKRFKSMKIVVLFASIPAMTTIFLMLWRYSYYGEIFPNTKYIKLVGEHNDGWDYVIMFIFEHSVLIGVVMGLSLITLTLSVFVDEFRNGAKKIAFTAVLFVPWIYYVIRIGGDIFPAFRHMVIICVGMSILTVLVVKLTASVSSLVRLPVALLFIVMVQVDLDTSWHYKLASIQGSLNTKIVGETIKSLACQTPTIVGVQTAGLLRYRGVCEEDNQRPRYIDLHGLNDYFIARNPKPVKGGGWLGHEVYNWHAVLGIDPGIPQPDLLQVEIGKLTLNMGIRKDPIVKSRFFADYAPMLIVHDEPLELWIRRDGSIGITANRDGLLIPSYLWAMAHRNEDMTTVVLKSNKDFDLYPAVDSETGRVVVRSEIKPAAWINLERGGWLVTAEGIDSFIVKANEFGLTKIVLPLEVDVEVPSVTLRFVR